MATKRNHAVRKHQYGVPLPLPALQQHQQQLQRSTPSATAQDLSLQQPANVTCSSWIPFFSIILSILRYLQRQCDIKVPPAQYHIQGCFHFSGSSVWISNSKDMEMLFRQGFFGKGTLSRSEATWKKRSAGNLQGVSLEDITRQRRVERAQWKIEKHVQSQQQSSSDLSVSTPLSSSMALSANTSGYIAPALTFSPVTQPQGPQLSRTVQQSPTHLTLSTDDANGVHQETAGSSGDSDEHLQLSLEEAFFLVFAVDCLVVSEQKTPSFHRFGGSCSARSLSIQECWLRFAQSSVSAVTSLMTPPTPVMMPDNPFIVRYAAYHYYRSLGWVVKDGLKYGTDYLLYQKGMMFGHSQFGIRVIACKSAAEARSGSPQHQSTGVGRPELPASLFSSTPGLFVTHAVHSWHWLLALNRVISQVQKVTYRTLQAKLTHKTEL